MSTNTVVLNNISTTELTDIYSALRDFAETRPPKVVVALTDNILSVEEVLSKVETLREAVRKQYLTPDGPGRWKGTAVRPGSSIIIPEFKKPSDQLDFEKEMQDINAQTHSITLTGIAYDKVAPWLEEATGVNANTLAVLIKSGVLVKTNATTTESQTA